MIFFPTSAFALVASFFSTLNCQSPQRAKVKLSRPAPQDFAGVRGISAVNSGMIRRAALVILGFLGLCFPVAGQQADTEADTITREQLNRTGAVNIGPGLSLYRPDTFRALDGSVLIHGLPTLTLLDGRRFPLSTALDRMGMAPLDLFPIAFLTEVEVQKHGASPISGTDAPGGVLDLRLNRNYSHGEMGVFYGKSGGKYGREDFQSYIVGTVGNQYFNITAGASYQESNGRIPGRGR
jgi:outer membrane receptor protein involved in Fe transport